MIIQLLLFVIVGIPSLLMGYAIIMGFREPENSPRKFIQRTREVPTDKQILVFAGDSLTHGRIGANYLNLLSSKLDSPRYELVNAGWNGELSGDLLQRMDDIISCNPHIVFFFIGANDIREDYENMDGQSENSSFSSSYHTTFKENLTSLIDRIQRETKAEVVLLSPSTQEEDTTHTIFKMTQDYSKTVRNLATIRNIPYIPVNESMGEYQEKHPASCSFGYKQMRFRLILSLIKHYIFKRSWNEIAEGNGLSLHIDHLHLNTHAATIISELLAEHILGRS